jgi:hypothetical protein
VGIGDLFALLLFILIVIALLPIIIPLMIYGYFQEKVQSRRFKGFLSENEGKKYFCYTARRTSVDYVKQNILPFLPADTTIIYLGDSKKIFLMGEDVPFLHRIVSGMSRTKGGYPYVSKVTDAKLDTISINNQLYSAIRRNADASKIIRKISRFLAGDDRDSM